MRPTTCFQCARAQLSQSILVKKTIDSQKEETEKGAVPGMKNKVGRMHCALLSQCCTYA